MASMKKASKAQAGARGAPFFDVVVVGGGAAGMMAAGRAAACGASVLLLEKNATLGKKLLISGGGRCNVTNNKPNDREMLAKYKNSGKFLFSTFSQFGVKDSIRFFEDNGVPLKEEHEGRLFPQSNKAQSIFDALVDNLEAGRVEVRSNAAVTGILSENEGISIALAKGKKITARACILATGGTSRPETGSTGDGFLWLKSLGHTVTANDFALVPLALHDEWTKKLGGVALAHVGLTLFSDGIKQSASIGKVLFTHVGVSGPAILNMSREVGELIKESSVVIQLDLFPKTDVGTLRKQLQELLESESNKKLKNVLSSIVLSSLVSPLLALAKIDGETFCHSVRSEDRTALTKLLKNVPLHVQGLLGANKAVVASGGVALEEINFKTMESRIVPGLYIVGDLLNIDRPSGGYSLQLCWSTGYVAGSAASRARGVKNIDNNS